MTEVINLNKMEGSASLPIRIQLSMIPTDPDFYKDLLDHMSDGVYFVDRNRRILYWNEGAHRLTGYKAEELIGRLCHDEILCHLDYDGNRLCHEGCPLSACMEDGSPREAKVYLRHKLGRRVPVSVRVQPIRDANGSITGALEIFSDDTAQNDARRRTEAMRRMAFLDHLTQLPNRRFMEMALQTTLNEFQTHNDPFGILVIDFDQFKKVNDSFGHLCGDRVLQQAARTLASSLRPADAVGRWGGDEFLAIVRGVTIEALQGLADRCTAIVSRTAIPVGDGRRVSVAISIGASMAQPGETAEELVHRADQLMYQKKIQRRCLTPAK
jgi:diguanylate cyclase (GGDEF)-like protein/PAS domain S-box-containing protein